MGCFHPQNAARNINDDKTSKQSLRRYEPENEKQQEAPSVSYMKPVMPNIVINCLADVVVQQREKHNYTTFYTDASPEQLLDMLENLGGHLKKNHDDPKFKAADIENGSGIVIKQGESKPGKAKNEDVLVIEVRRGTAFCVRRIGLATLSETQKDELIKFYEERTKLQKNWNQGVQKAFEIMISDSYLYIVLEYIPFTLGQHNEIFRGAVREDFLLNFFTDGIAALNYFFQAFDGFPQPGISPGNVLVDIDGSLKLNFVPNFTKLEDLKKVELPEEFKSPEYALEPFKEDVPINVVEGSLLYSFGLVFLSVVDSEITKKYIKSWNKNQKDLESCLDEIGKRIPDYLLLLVRKILSWSPEDRGTLSDLLEECNKEKKLLANLIKERLSEVQPENAPMNLDEFLDGDTKIVVQAADRRVLLDAGLLAFSPVFRAFCGYFEKIPAFFCSSDSLLLIEDFYRLYDFETSRLEEDAEFFDLDVEPNLFSEVLNARHNEVFKNIMISDTKFNLEKSKAALTSAAQLYSSFHDLDRIQLGTYQKLFEISQEIDEQRMRAVLKKVFVKNPLLFVTKFYAHV